MSESNSTITYDISKLDAYEFFGYWPSLALASIALTLYILGALVTGLQGFLAKHRYARHMYLVTLTGLTEAGGYVALVWLIENSGETNIYGAYVAFQVLTVLSPNLLQAANYATVGKAALLSGLSAKKKFLRPTFLSLVFVGVDVLALVVQAVGISIWASSKGSGNPDQDKITLGSWITVAGLAIQLTSFMIFASLAIWVQRHSGNRLSGTKKNRRLFWGLYITIVLITVRNIFRFVEFIQEATLPFPPDSGTYVISEQQALFYTLDALPILLCFLFYILLHPAYLLPREIIEDGQGDDRKASDPPAAQGGPNIDNSIFKPTSETPKGGNDLEDLENGRQVVQ